MTSAKQTKKARSLSFGGGTFRKSDNSIDVPRAKQAVDGNGRPGRGGMQDALNKEKTPQLKVLARLQARLAGAL